MATKNIKITIDSALNAGGFRRAEAELSNLSSNVKSAAKTITKIGGALAIIPAAFKKGMDIGTWISDKFVMPFMKAKNVVDSVSVYSDRFFESISKASAEGLLKIADTYKSITNSAKSAADSRQRETRYLQDQLKLLRDAKDAEKELAKQRKLSSLSPDDTYGRAKVEQEFSASAGLDAAMRLKEDAVLKRQNLEKEAEAAKKTAGEIDKVISGLEKKLLAAKSRAGMFSTRSVERNEKDISWKNWFGFSRTSEGDELREKQKKAAEDAKKEASKIQKDIDSKREEAAKLRSEADDAIKRREALLSQIETAEIKIESERLKNADAVAKIEADNQKVIEEAKKRTLEFENQRTESLVEYKNKLESIFGDSFSIDVEEPKPIDVKVNEPKPIKVETITPRPVDIQVKKPDAVDVNVNKPKPVDVKVNEPKPVDVKVDEQKPVDIKVRETGIAEVKKAFDALRTAKTNDEIKSAKKSLDIAIKSVKAELEGRRDGMKKLHDERMAQLDKEAEKAKKKIDDAKAKGFDNVMATAGGGAWGQGTLDQAGDIQAERFKKIGEDRAQKAQDALKAKMARVGATLDDPSKLGRMSNLERAAFEAMKLAEAEAQAKKLQEEKDERQKAMVKNLDEINKKLKEVGL